MKMNANVVLVGLEKRNGVKDPSKVYKTALFFQGTDSLDCMCSDESYAALEAVPVYSAMEVEFDYSHKYKSIKLASVKQVIQQNAQHNDRKSA